MIMTNAAAGDDNNADGKGPVQKYDQNKRGNFLLIGISLI